MGNQKIQKKNGDNAPKRFFTKKAGPRTTSTTMSGDQQRVSITANDRKPGIPLTPGNLRFLQRNAGNNAVGALLQAKLKVGQSGDKYEREADRIADKVMRMPDPAIKRKPT